MKPVRRRWVPYAMVVVAVGVHVAIVAALPKARPAVTFAAPIAAAELAPRVSTLQVSAAQLAQQPATPAPVAAPARAPKPAAVAHFAHATAPAPARDENKTIDMRPRHDNEPVVIATPLPVTIVMPPSDPR